MPFFLERVDVKHGGRMPLSAGAVSIGRSPGNTVVLTASDRGVSAYHAVIYADPQRMLLQDLQSTNGTFVNGRRVQECALNAGDEIGLGRSGPKFRVTADDEGDGGINGINGINTINTINTINSINSINSGINNIIGINSVNGISGINSINNINGINNINPVDNIDSHNGINNVDGINRINSISRINNINNINSIDDIDSGINRPDRPDRGGGTDKRDAAGRTPTILIAAAVGLFIVMTLSILLTSALITPTAKTPTAKPPTNTREFFSPAAAANPDHPVALAGQSAPHRGASSLQGGEFKSTPTSTSTSTSTSTATATSTHTPTAVRINDVLSRFGEGGYRAPPEMVERVEHYLNLYQGAMRRTVALWMERGQRYFPMIRTIFSEKNVPIELAYVSMLESGFNTEAVSHAGAAGMWQFMPQTARRYGLRVGGGADERTDPEKSTRAAAAYFKDLIAIFGSNGSVLLCMAAYNAGEQRVINALKRIDDPVRDRDFWYLYRMGWLAAETNEYIPQVIALIIISDKPEEYGF